MGPRIFIRGYRRATCRSTSVSTFNGAADFHPRIRPCRNRVSHPCPASMGPRIFIRGYSSAKSPSSRRCGASMGPRIFIRGYGSRLNANAGPPRFNGAADFHPRILLASGKTAVFDALQWGRGFSSADTGVGPGALALRRASMGPRIFIRGYLEGRNALLRVGGLQWGRGFSSADTHAPAWQPRDTRRFNGAADFHPRIRRVPRAPTTR